MQESTETFLASLEGRRSQVVYDATPANASNWTNLPCQGSCRNGVAMAELTDGQRAHALAILQAALSNVPAEGYAELEQTVYADDLLHNAVNPNRQALYGSGTYKLAFVGEPSMSKPFLIQFGGHHVSKNIAVENGAVSAVTPSFSGIEPTQFDYVGNPVKPLGNEQAGLVSLVASLSPEARADAALAGNFLDVTVGPGQDGRFPPAPAGVPVGELSTQQQQAVLNALRPWVEDAPPELAAAYMQRYQNELKETYLSLSGGSTMAAPGDYLRIDGPSLWLEYACREPIAFKEDAHCHSVWRDKKRDYAGLYPPLLP